MSDFLKNSIRFVLFLAFGLFLFWLAYRGIDTQTVVDSLSQANLWWIALSLVLGIVSHLSRTLRWRLLLEPLGRKPSVKNTFFAVMVMYLANLALPRLGEVSRCSIMKRYEDIPFSKSLGTVFLERMVDMVVLLLMFIIVLITQFNVISNFLLDAINQKFNHSIDMQQLVLFLIVLGFVGILILWYYCEI